LNRPVIEEVLPSLYRVEVPLPRNPLKATNSYILKSDRNLIVDTGMNQKECMDALSAAFKYLNIDLTCTDFFVTHLHADHLGLVGELVDASSIVYFNQPDAETINNQQLWQDLFLMAGKHGFSDSELKSALGMHPGHRYSPKGPLKFTIVREGDRITAGDYNWQCVETPGHTRGHICLYESKRKILISGDHILGDITPNISSWDDRGNPLRDYRQSLDKVSAMEVELVLPGHRSVLTECKRRIDELKVHHELRLEELSDILHNIGAASAYQIASLMRWDIIAENWNGFPIMQKWFATGEAIAHLKYLEEEGAVLKNLEDSKILYFLA
jgi:glyoxylase-like metal-dependent hydrolase (beta-lactamase superfamily II)